MDRIQGVTAAPGNQFTEGDPATAVPATIVSALWLNGVQEELIGVIEAASITPDDADNGQVLDALNSLFPPKAATETALTTLDTTVDGHETRIDSLESLARRLEGASDVHASGISVPENVWTRVAVITVPGVPDTYRSFVEVNACFDGSPSSSSVIGLMRVRSSAGGAEQSKASFLTFPHADGTTFSVGASIAGLVITNGSTTKPKTVELEVLVRNGSLSSVSGSIAVRRLSGYDV